MTIDQTEAPDNLSAEEREILEYMLQNEQHSRTAQGMIPRCDKNKDAVLSFGQQRSWLVHELNKEQASSYDTLTINLRARGPLKIDALQRSLNEIARRHEILRTTFVLKGDEPVQVVNAVSTALEQVDISQLPEVDREAKLHELLHQANNTLFDLAKGPMFRARLIRLGETDHVLIMIMHHIIFDGWSNGILTHELGVLYNNYATEQPSSLPELSIQYRDFSEWQRTWLKGDVLNKHLGYWTQQLADLPTLELPTDHARPAVQSFSGASETLSLPRELSIALIDLSKARGTTLFMTMLAVLGLLLYRYSRQDDIGIGTVIANRDREELQDLVGFFLNTLVMRLDLSGEPSYSELLERVKQTARHAFAHQHLPFEKLVEEMHLERDRSHTPLFQVLFSVQGDPDPKATELKDLSLNRINLPCDTTRFDLEVYVTERPSALGLCFIYNSDLFDGSSIRQMLGHYRNLLRAVVADIDRPIGMLPMLSPEEQQQITQQWNSTAEAYPYGDTLAQLFEQQVDRSPLAIAVDYNGQTLTYGELDTRCNLLAQHLNALDVGPETLVGVFMERSLEMVTALLGIIKAGGAYVPLDPDYPQERIRYMLEDTGVTIVLSQQHLRDKLPGSQANIICCDSDWDTVAQSSGDRLDPSATPDSLAYVIYTSGSTGKPKGVMNEHRGVVNRLQWMQSRFQLDAEDRVLQKTPFSFDVSVWEFFWPLITGARLVVAVPGGHKDPAYLSNIIEQKNISTLHFVPSMLKTYLEQNDMGGATGLKRVVCSGEALTGELRQRFFADSNAELHNLYGPTEAAIDVTSWACRRDEPGDNVPIGRPIANTQIYILDTQMQPVPAGVAGELHIGGIQVARGYLNRPDLTAEKFIEDPFSSETGARLYKTGDLARYLPDGNIEYLGRIDHQVKLRGFRIELGEIESVLCQHTSVRTAVVECRQDANREPRLVAYVVSSAEQQPSAIELRDLVQTLLPNYMVPSTYTVLDALPLTSSGKVDRRALPAPPDEPQLKQYYVAPRTELEQQLAGIWQDTLSISKVGIHDNFFDLGGHSLTATRVMSRVRNIRELDLPVAILFDNPTIAALAENIQAMQWVRQSIEAVDVDQEAQRQEGEL